VEVLGSPDESKYLSSGSCLAFFQADLSSCTLTGGIIGGFVHLNLEDV
jgi:hypothetical protein